MPKATRRQPILVPLLHEVAGAETCETLADVIEALKCRAARLRIPYDATLVTEAIAMVGRTRPLVVRASGDGRERATRTHQG